MITLGFITEAFLLALALSMDCFTVSITCGLQKTLTLKRGLFMAFCFGFFQALMPFLGSLLTGLFKSIIASSAPWIAFGLLFIIGLKMVIEGRNFKLREKVFDVGQMKVILLLSIATSIDAFVVGVGFSLQWDCLLQTIAVLIIGVVTFIMSIIGWKMGEKVFFVKPRFALSLGGFILIFLGVKIIVSHFINL